MGNQNEKFFSLTPETLNENKKIYTEALDFAFSNNSIKNIAVTGIYGAGKSTVWNTYVEQKEINNIITVSLGKYEDYDEKKDTINENFDIDSNRIERQIINQILSQIKSKDIPLSKYRFKQNKSKTSIGLNISSIIAFILALIMWLSKDIINTFFIPQIIGIKGVAILFLLFLMYPIIFWSYRFIKSNRLYLSKINIKGAEAKFNELFQEDETILERDMKEIVYLLNCSNAKIVVFEDLDRYDNIDIFTKLRELNFLLNSFLKTQDDDNNEVVKFVYMLRDGIFFSKNRTKFFDFIIPIVPVVDSKNSENKLLESLNTANNIPDKRTISKISLYIDDMRLLKNIINEYLVYENIIAMDELELDPNKLFSLVVLKNIFPKEFDLLQSDEGYIFDVFKNIDIYKKNVRAKLEKHLDEVNQEINFLNNRHENSKFEAMAAMISPNIRRNYYDERFSWSEFLKEQSEKPDEKFDINYVYNGSSSTWGYYTYETFMEKYIINTEDKKKIIEKLPINRKNRITELLEQKNTLERNIREISIGLVRNQLELMSSDEINDIFKINEKYEITNSHYFSLIRALILQGLIDETYWHYKGYFYKGSLGKNDTIFIKNLLEAKPQDIFLKVENPMELMNRLEVSDYSKFNILNQNILELSIQLNRDEQIFKMVESVEVNDNYDSLLQLLNTYNYNTIKKFVKIILERYTHNIIEILDKCDVGKQALFKNILMSICTNTNIDKDTIILFKDYIEENENIISLIAEEDFDVFIKNIISVDVKFEAISESEATKDRIKIIESRKLFKLTVDNVKFISETILDHGIKFSHLLDEINNSELLSSTKKYIDSNFVDFITMYIDNKNDNETFSNNEDIVIEIINSDLSDNYKQSYIMNNETRISDISKIEHLSKKETLLNILLEKNIVIFTPSNINCYQKSINSYSGVFINYIDKNINKNNYKEILLENNSVCDSFINDHKISDKVFSYVLKCANSKINNIDEELTQDRIKELVEKGFISITNDNIRKMLNNKFYTEIVLLVNSQNKELEDEAILILLSLDISSELVYQLINSNISYENSEKLLDTIISDVLVEKISFEKIDIFSYIIDRGLSENNINYICRHFDSFRLKDKYINYLDKNALVSYIKNENLTDSFIQMILSKTNIHIESKLDIIITKIKENASKNELAKLISSIDEISELSNVWNNKRPVLNNEYKEKIGEILIEFGYVAKIKYGDLLRIMEIKKI